MLLWIGWNSHSHPIVEFHSEQKGSFTYSNNPMDLKMFERKLFLVVAHSYIYLAQPNMQLYNQNIHLSAAVDAMFLLVISKSSPAMDWL